MFNKISQAAFDELQLGAGVVLKNFDPNNPELIENSNIICATTGGINISCIPTYSDLGADIDNCPNNVIELKKLEGWDCKMSFTALNVTSDSIALALGSCMQSNAGGFAEKMDGIIPIEHPDLLAASSDVWWVGERSDGNVVAARLRNALSTGGFNLKTTKNGKGQLNIELTGHMTYNADYKSPMEFYVQVTS